MRHARYIFILCLLLAPQARAEDDALGSLGSIIDAGAPIAIAGMQAGADKAIASINADASVRMTQISSDTTKSLATDQKDIALYQAMTAEQMNNENQKAVTERLAMQLSSLADARHGAERAEQEKLMIEQQYNQERIALAAQEAANTVKLAKAKLNAEISIAGLSGSFAYSGSHLTFGTPRSFSGSLSLMARNSVVGNPRGATGTQDSGNTTNDATSDTAAAPRRVINTPRAPRPGGPRTATVPRLLASLGDGRGASRVRNLSARALGPQPFSGVRGAVVRGSFPGTPVKVSLPSGSASHTVRSQISGRPHATNSSLALRTPLSEEDASEGSTRHRRSQSETSD